MKPFIREELSAKSSQDEPSAQLCFPQLLRTILGKAPLSIHRVNKHCHSGGLDHFGDYVSNGPIIIVLVVILFCLKEK